MVAVKSAGVTGFVAGRPAILSLAPYTCPPLMPPSAKSTLKHSGQCSRPALLLVIFGERPNSAATTTSVSSSFPAA